MNLVSFKKSHHVDTEKMYSTRDGREAVIKRLLDDAKCAKSGTEQYFQKMRMLCRLPRIKLRLPNLCLHQE